MDARFDGERARFGGAAALFDDGRVQFDCEVPCAMLLHLPASIFAAPTAAGQTRPELAGTGSGQQHEAAGEGQPAATVVYVALGSEVPLSVELELAGFPFLWAMRKPVGVGDADTLPPGFEERTRGRGLFAMGWVPQISILAHGAVGAFLTHCGWNSIVEGLLFGRPLIMLPIHGDQGSNARLMEGRQLGVQVPRDEEDGSFDRHAVVRAVRAVTSEDASRKIFVANAKKLQEIVADRTCQERCIDEFVERLRSSCLG